MTLKEIILDEMARKWGYSSWKKAVNKSLQDFVLYEALDRLDSVMRWASLNGWVVFTDKEEKQWRRHTPRIKDFGEKEFLTDAELLQLYKEKNP